MTPRVTKQSADNKQSSWNIYIYIYSPSTASRFSPIYNACAKQQFCHHLYKTMFLSTCAPLQQKEKNTTETEHFPISHHSLTFPSCPYWKTEETASQTKLPCLFPSLPITTSLNNALVYCEIYSDGHSLLNSANEKSLLPSWHSTELGMERKLKTKHKLKQKWNVKLKLDPRWVAERPTQLRAAGLKTCSQWHKYTRLCTPYIWKCRKAEGNAVKL